jgi:hypothetical protein
VTGISVCEKDSSYTRANEDVPFYNLERPIMVYKIMVPSRGG